MQAPGFWDDQEAAARTSGEHTAREAQARALGGDLRRRGAISASWPRWPPRTRRWRPSSAPSSTSIESRLGELEEERLFSGEHDAGDAVVTVRSGAGGTDSQDWAEMLLRMYLRWAESRGFKTEMKEASEGEEAGLKSATFIARGENAYGLFAAERGRPPARPDLAVRLAVATPYGVRAARRRPACLRRRRDRPRRVRHPRRHLPRLGRRRPARQQDRLRGPAHP